MDTTKVENMFTWIKEGYGWCTEEYVENLDLTYEEKDALIYKLNKAGMLKDEDEITEN